MTNYQGEKLFLFFIYNQYAKIIAKTIIKIKIEH